ncbi:conserved oligomeric Golgi complex subunit 5-like protein, partial [Euroglyphus maynei]
MHLMERIDESKLFDVKNEQAIFLKEIVKLSQYINEIDGIIESDGENRLLHKLNCISNDLEKFRIIRTKLLGEVDLLLKNGLESSLDQNVISTAIQVYHNLRLLNQIVNDLIDAKCHSIEQSLSKLFDDMNMKELKLSLPSSRQNNLMKTSIRSDCKFNLENLYNHFHQLSMMIRMMKKRRDNQTQTLLIEFIDGKDELLRRFWQEIIGIFSKTFDQLFQCSPVIKKLIESDYPKILSLFLDYSRRIITDEPDIEREKSLRTTIEQFEQAYLSNSLSSLFESVNRIFGVMKISKIDSIPSEKDVDIVINDISNEISVTNFDPILLESICRNIVKTINLFAFKCEQLVSNDGDATQVIGKFTINQRHNSLIIHTLNYFQKQLKNLIKNNERNHLILKKHLEQSSLKTIDNLILNTFEPFISSIQDAIEDIILTIHNENYNINRIHRMAAFVIDFFLLQNCLIRPISAIGRRKIANDFQQLEEIIIPICNRLGNVGRSFQILKAFKTLLPLSPEELCESTIIGDPIPHYLVIHFFISNYTANELKSPYEFKDWSIGRYSQWFMANDDD